MNKENIWKRKIEDSRFIVICLVVILACATGLSLIYYRKVNAAKLLENIEFQYGDNYLSYVDFAGVKDGKLVIEGWVTQLEHDEDNIRRDAVLFDQENNIILLRTVQKIRTSVTEYFNDGKNHDASGYKAIARIKTIPSGEMFRVGVLVSTADNKKYLVKTDKTVIKTNGEITIGEEE